MLELINPPDLHTPKSYTHVAIATGSRLVFIAGQVAEDGQGTLIGVDDFGAQARQAFANVGHCLAAAGARPDQLARITIYVVGHRPEYLPLISAALMELCGEHRPADTLIGVESLFEPGYLIEVEAIAVAD